MMMTVGALFATRYQLQRLLGRGAFSEVWLAHDRKTGVDVAIKIYAPSTGLDDEGLEMFAHEFSVVMNINHQNLLKPIYFDDFERQPYLVLPYCAGGSVKSRIGKLSEAEAWKMIRDVAAGLAWLHAMQPPVVHQDIKPDNIMLGSRGEYLITDFGVSTGLRSTLRRSQAGKGSDYDSAGTTAYMAPERFSRQNKPIKANDVYSLGATMFEMLTGDVPFGNLGGIIYHQGADLPELDCSCSQQLKDVVEHCLAKDPWDRPVAAQLEEWAKIGLKGGVIDFSRKWEGDEPVAPPSGGTGGGGRPTERKHNDSGTGKDGDPPTPAFGALSVSSVPTGADVYIDGTHVGTTPVVFPGLSVGTHEVEMRKEGYVSATQTATIKAGREDAVSLTLQAIPPVPPPPSDPSGIKKWAVVIGIIAILGAVIIVLTRPTKLSLSCETANVALYVDGTMKGTGNWAGKVSPGSHRLEARKDGYTTATHTLTVREGRTVKYTFPALTVSAGSLRVTSDPSGADVYIDGTRVGTTPGSFSSLTAGAHQVVVRKTGYTSATRTATVSGGQEVTVTLTLQSTGRGSINGHEYVDLGLSVKWATCNVGASSPNDYGNYYAWGETTTKSSYDANNSKTYNNSSYVRDISGDPSLDAARANWGGTWRMPNKTEFQELLNQCSWQWTTQGGRYGYKVTSTKNGNSIFLPAAGLRGSSSLSHAGENGIYWSSSPGEGSSCDAYRLLFYDSYKDLHSNYGCRYLGFPVRPVLE